jgi:lysophospholipase L1-like esterase
MTHRSIRALVAIVLPVLLAQAGSTHAAPPSGAWREAFQSSPASTDVLTDADFRAFAERLKMPPDVAERVRPRHVSGTLRYNLVVSAGGAALRVRLSNETGRGPLRLTAVSVARASAGFDAVVGSVHAVTFSGQRGVTIPAGAPMLSDPVDLPVAAGGAVLISVHGDDEFVLTGNGGSALSAAPGDQTMALRMDGGMPLAGRPIVTGISVLTPTATRVVVAMGDSITDGNRGELAALHSWPEQLARRLAAAEKPLRHAVVNAGIGGNRLLQAGFVSEFGISALARLDRDALRLDGVTDLLLLEGTNDIGSSGDTVFGHNPLVTIEELVAGYRQVIARAHARGVRVIIGTIPPFGGSPSHSSPEKDALRQKANDWIRRSHEPDGVIDFDAAIRDAADPNRMQERFDSGDHLHPNEAGSRAMGEAVDLALLR